LIRNLSGFSQVIRSKRRYVTRCHRGFDDLFVDVIGVFALRRDFLTDWAYFISSFHGVRLQVCMFDATTMLWFPRWRERFRTSRSSFSMETAASLTTVVD